MNDAKCLIKKAHNCGTQLFLLSEIKDTQRKKDTPPWGRFFLLKVVSRQGKVKARSWNHFYNSSFGWRIFFLLTRTVRTCVPSICILCPFTNTIKLLLVHLPLEAFVIFFFAWLNWNFNCVLFNNNFNCCTWPLRQDFISKLLSFELAYPLQRMYKKIIKWDTINTWTAAREYSQRKFVEWILVLRQRMSFIVKRSITFEMTSGDIWWWR